MQVVALVVSLGIAAVGVVLFVRAIRQMLAVIRMGQPAHRTDDPAARAVTLLKESLGHTRMLQWTWVGVLHWFVFVGFGLLFFTLLTAFGQLFDPHFALPLIGHFAPFEWATELVTWVMVVAIVVFIAYRATRPKERVRGADGRFYGSTMWQAYFVEAVILGVGLCILTLRGLEYALMGEEASAFHFPFTFWLGEAFSGASESSLENAIWAVATLKIVISFVWMITISLNITMGVAWHRFAAFFNIFFKRESSGRTALGAAKPLTNAGVPITLDDIDDLDEDVSFGVGKIEDFSWKGLLDFTTCTECGRCQSQCPAWNTEKPLSPKLMILQLRDHAYAKAPYVLAGGGADGSADGEVPAGVPASAVAEAERALVGPTEGYAWDPTGGAVIDPDVLWSCVTCGACVQQCPVDIEHVDHIVDMRRYQVLVESSFPAELNQLFKGLESKGNPWNMAPTARLEWTKGLDFDVPVVGEDLESLESVDWLFWVGCAGAYEDRAKKTARAVAELLNIAGVTFGVLGNGETCTGDSARRAGNEFVFQGLAQQNIETFKEFQVKKVVSTCAHCFNTLKNEYKHFGIELEVVHHTQLLNRLVREGRLTPVTSGAGASKRSITYHDPCYLGRHNQVFEPPRELLQVLPGADFVEMERNSERSFCCGAGGARMWMEEKIGERINLNRTTEAVGTGADQIAVGCPFCRVMLSDGLTALQAQGGAREEVEVLDVAQMLLASVKGESATKVPAGAATAPSTAAPSTAAASATATAVETKAEPEPGDITQTEDTVTETADVGPAAKASGGTSLFDTPAGDADEKPAPAAPASGGSLFDTPARAEPAAPATGASLFDTPAPAPAEEEPAPAAPASGGSLFDVAPTEPTTDEPAPPAPPTTGGSLFDVAPTEPTTDEPAPPAPPTTDGSLFDVPPSEPPAQRAPASETPAEPSNASDGPQGLFDVEPTAAPAAPDPVAISEAATAAAASDDDPETILDADDDPAVPAASEEPVKPRGLFDVDEPAEPPAPAEETATADELAEAPSNEASESQPRTDVDLDKPRSLFDI